MEGPATYLEHLMDVIEETKHYVMIRAEYRGDFINKKDVLNLLEGIREEGYRPLHFEAGNRAFVCEKMTFAPTDLIKDAENISAQG